MVRNHLLGNRWAFVVGLGLWTMTSAAEAAFPTIRLEPVNLNQIVAPVGITNAGDGSNRLFVTDQRGTIHVLQNQNLLPTPFLEIGSKLVPERANFDERGLLGLAFHPNFGQAGQNGSDKFYVFYTAPHPNAPGTTEDPINSQSVIAEYRVGSDPNVADPNYERILLTITKPQFNHNGGHIEFGPDGYLYVNTGDGGSSNDNNAGHTGGDPTQPSGVLGNSQDRTKLSGKVLRLDVLGTNGPTGQYGIPGDNPFVGAGGGVREEIYAYGLRNPWRGSFDSGPGGTGRYFVADVGQGNYEEVNIIESGKNYGWRIKEGNQDFDPTVTPVPSVPLTGPIAEYAHPNSVTTLPKIGLSVTGGVVYRGDDFPELQGKYIFGDWSNGFAAPNGTLLGLEETAPGQFDFSVLNVEGGNPIGKYIQGFGLGEDGEAYLATRTTLAVSARDPVSGLPTGGIYRIAVVPEPAGGLALLLLATAARFLRRRLA